jgi:hypothetical protein
MIEDLQGLQVLSAVLGKYRHDRLEKKAKQ